MRRNVEHEGLFSLFITNLGEIKKAIDNGHIPIIDMQNYKNIYLDESKLGKENAWEYYFQQPMNYSLNNIKSTDKVKLNNFYKLSQYPDPYIDIGNELNMWQEYAKKYIKLQPHIEKKINEEYNHLILKKDRVLGVLARGTDYTSLKPYGHPIQPEVDVLIKKVKEEKEKQNYNKIFLASEDKDIVKKFKEEFGDALIRNKQSLKNYDGKSYIGQIEYNRENDRYLSGLEYLTTIIILSKCNAIIAGRTSGLIAALILNDNNYEYHHIYTLGSYPTPFTELVKSFYLTLIELYHHNPTPFTELLKGWKRGAVLKLKFLLGINKQK